MQSSYRNAKGAIAELSKILINPALKEFPTICEAINGHILNLKSVANTITPHDFEKEVELLQKELCEDSAAYQSLELIADALRSSGYPDHAVGTAIDLVRNRME